MLAELRSRVPAFEHLSADSREDVLVGLDRTLKRWSRFMATGVMPADADFAPLREWARARAGEGIRLEDLMRAFGVLHQTGWRLLCENARPEEGAALIELAGRLAEYAERVSVLVTETYLAERELLVSEEERRTRSLLDRLVGGEALDAAERELAESLGVWLEAPLVPFAAVLPGARAHRHAALAARLRRRGIGLTVTQSDAVVGLAPHPPTLEDLDEGAEVLLAVAEPTPREELRFAREELRLLVAHARRHGLSGRVSVSEHLLEVILAGSARLTNRLQAQVLGALRAVDPGGELERTLRTLFSHRLDRRRTSEELHIHRNTLAYRLARIERATGMELDSPRDIARLYAALQAPVPGESGQGVS
jgi:hypothetical protein